MIFLSLGKDKQNLSNFAVALFLKGAQSLTSSNIAPQHYFPKNLIISRHFVSKFLQYSTVQSSQSRSCIILVIPTSSLYCQHRWNFRDSHQYQLPFTPHSQLTTTTTSTYQLPFSISNDQPQPTPELQPCFFCVNHEKGGQSPIGEPMSFQQLFSCQIRGKFLVIGDIRAA